jgi:hypothetical protein
MLTIKEEKLSERYYNNKIFSFEEKFYPIQEQNILNYEIQCRAGHHHGYEYEVGS